MMHIAKYIESRMKTFCNRNFTICSLAIVAFIKAFSDSVLLCGFKTSFFQIHNTSTQ